MTVGMMRVRSQQWAGHALKTGFSPRISALLPPPSLKTALMIASPIVQRSARPALCSAFHTSSFWLSSETEALKVPPKITTDSIIIGGKTYPKDDVTNVTVTILEKTSRQLHLIPAHPIATIKDRIASTFPGFKHYDQFSPVVTTKENFDDLCFSDDHPGRSVTDTYYLNNKIMLRTHTSAHQLQTLKESDKLLVTADVYRRDEIDASHYPAFHQMEGAQLFDAKTVVADVQKDIKEALAANPASAGIQTTDTTLITPENPKQDCHDEAAMLATADHLKHSLNMMVRRLFSQEKNLQVRWIDAQFPFTSPSWEMEILYQGKWLEVLGCGVIRQDILNNAGKSDKIGWAFGLGLERLAMVLYGIPDIRLFWSQDARFLRQFEPSKIQKFKPFSKYSPCIKDISFWVPEGFHENNFCEIVRDVAGDIAETVELIDKFTHPKTNRQSVCFRINYRSMDRNVTNNEINEIQEKLRTEVVDRMKVELR